MSCLFEKNKPYLIIIPILVVVNMDQQKNYSYLMAPFFIISYSLLCDHSTHTHTQGHVKRT